MGSVLQVQQRVVYGIHGVCVIQQIQEQIVDYQKKQYYVLVPVDRADTQYLIPVDNEIAVSKLHPLLTKEELECMLCSKAMLDDVWIPEENLRKMRYKELTDRRFLLWCVLCGCIRNGNWSREKSFISVMSFSFGTRKS